MAEYIDRAKVDYEFIRTRGGGDIITNLYERILDIPTADVIERPKIDKAIEEMEREINSDFWNNSFCDGMKFAREILKRNIGE